MKMNNQLDGTSSVAPVRCRQVSAHRDGPRRAPPRRRCDSAPRYWARRRSWRPDRTTSVSTAMRRAPRAQRAWRIGTRFERSLASRVGRADDVDHISLALVRLAERCAVVDTAAREFGQPVASSLRYETPVATTSARLSISRTRRTAPRVPGRGSRSRRHRAPAPSRRRTGTPGRWRDALDRSRSAPWETRDSSQSPRSAGLAARRLALDDHRAQPSDAAYTAAARPAGPPPTMQRS